MSCHAEYKLCRHQCCCEEFACPHEATFDIPAPNQIQQQFRLPRIFAPGVEFLFIFSLQGGWLDYRGAQMRPQLIGIVYYVLCLNL